MNNITMIIMAAGVSSRMKASNGNYTLPKEQVSQSNTRAKGIY